jgi:hypothetical protein
MSSDSLWRQIENAKSSRDALLRCFSEAMESVNVFQEAITRDPSHTAAIRKALAPVIGDWIGARFAECHRTCCAHEHLREQDSPYSFNEVDVLLHNEKGLAEAARAIGKKLSRVRALHLEIEQALRGLQEAGMAKAALEEMAKNR